MDKEKLKEYFSVIKEIEELEREREKIMAKALAPPKSDGQPHGKGGVSDPSGKAGIKLVEVAILIDEKTDILIALRREIEGTIDPLPSAQRRLMRLRYIDGMTWPSVAGQLYGSKGDFFDKFDSYKRRVLRDHGKILERMRKCP